MKSKKNQPMVQPQEAAKQAPRLGGVELNVGDKGTIQMKTPRMERSVFMVAECVEKYTTASGETLVSIKWFNHAAKKIEVWNVGSQYAHLLK